MELREMIRAILLENAPVLENTIAMQNSFPYGPGNVLEPQQVDPLSHYVLDWERLSTNNSVFEFPKEEFELGIKIERNKDPKAQILDVANKVIETLKGDPHFYSSLNDRMK